MITANEKVYRWSFYTCKPLQFQATTGRYIR